MFGIQVTLTGGTTAQNLLALLRAIDANIPGAVRELYIQADAAVAGTLLIGDALLSSTRYGVAQVVSSAPATPLNFRTSSVQSVPLGAFYLLSSASMKVNILAYA